MNGDTKCDPAVRVERPQDAAAIRRLHQAAFGGDAEARLVERLRAAGRARISVVAESDAALVGHALFSPVSVDGAPQACGLALAPVAVHPHYQRRGVGTQLVFAGLNACRADGAGFVVVLGDPAWYRRFGFVPAARHGLEGELGGGEAFQVLELAPGALPPRGGLVRYVPELRALDAR